VASISRADVVELLAIFDRNGIEVWLNGGWGVDALPLISASVAARIHLELGSWIRIAAEAF